jgi:hypothetical protein
MYAVYCSNQPFINGRIKEFTSKYKEFGVVVDVSFVEKMRIQPISI